MGPFCSSTLLPSFASIPSRDGYYILHLPRQATAWSPLGWAPGLLYIQHCNSAGVLRFASTPLSGSGSFASTSILEWFLWVLMDTTSCSSPVTKIPSLLGTLTECRSTGRFSLASPCSHQVDMDVWRAIGNYYLKIFDCFANCIAVDSIPCRTSLFRQYSPCLPPLVFSLNFVITFLFFLRVFRVPPLQRAAAAAGGSGRQRQRRPAVLCGGCGRCGSGGGARGRCCCCCCGGGAAGAGSTRASGLTAWGHAVAPVALSSYLRARQRLRPL